MVMSWAAGSFQMSQRQKLWRKPLWRTCRVSILPTCSLGHNLATMGSCLAGAAAAPGATATRLACPAAVLSIIQAVFYAKGMPTQKALTYLSCLQPCWRRTGLGLPMQHCRINALLNPSFTPSKASGNTCSSHCLKCLL